MPRMSMFGGVNIQQGSYAGKTEQVIVEAALESAGGRSKNRRRYPRWVMIDGQRYRVNSPEEERQLLQAMLDRARTVEATGTHTEAQAAIRRQVRLKTRIKAVDDSEAQWLERLRNMDEEILILM